MVQLVDKNIDKSFKQVVDYGFKCCQLCGWNKELFTDEVAELVNYACEKYGITISTFWCGWGGPGIWNFYEGPLTLGLVPTEYRYERMKDLMAGSDFAKKINVSKLATHAGFLPENPNSEQYREVICVLKSIANHCGRNGQKFIFETGQETPVTLRRTIEDIGTENVGINLDPANLILYGKANPIDALDVFGEFVLDVHAKDGCYPTDGKNLGKETPIGEGKVNFPEFVKKLKAVGYDGTLIIEREITGEQQIKDIMKAKEYLEKLI